MSSRQRGNGFNDGLVAQRIGLGLLVVGICLFLLPAVGEAAVPKLGKGEASSAARSALERYYREEWRRGRDKEVESPYCYSRTHCQVFWHFEPASGGYFFGDVIVYRGRSGGIFARVRPSPECEDCY